MMKQWKLMEWPNGTSVFSLFTTLGFMSIMVFLTCLRNRLTEQNSHVPPNNLTRNQSTRDYRHMHKLALSVTFQMFQ